MMSFKMRSYTPGDCIKQKILSILCFVLSTSVQMERKIFKPVLSVDIVSPFSREFTNLQLKFFI